MSPCHWSVGKAGGRVAEDRVVGGLRRQLHGQQPDLAARARDRPRRRGRPRAAARRGRRPRPGVRPARPRRSRASPPPATGARPPRRRPSGRPSRSARRTRASRAAPRPRPAPRAPSPGRARAARPRTPPAARRRCAGARAGSHRRPYSHSQADRGAGPGRDAPGPVPYRSVPTSSRPRLRLAGAVAAAGQREAGADLGAEAGLGAHAQLVEAALRLGLARQHRADPAADEPERDADDARVGEVVATRTGRPRSPAPATPSG